MDTYDKNVQLDKILSMKFIGNGDHKTQKMQ